METEFYKNGDICVTNSRFIVGNDTYAINGITSVKTLTKKKDFLLVFMIAFCWGLSIIINLANGERGDAVVSAIGFVALCYWISKLRKPKYSVIVTSSSGENEAYTTKEAGKVAAIVAAINQAIITRG